MENLDTKICKCGYEYKAFTNVYSHLLMPKLSLLTCFYCDYGTWGAIYSSDLDCVEESLYKCFYCLESWKVKTKCYLGNKNSPG